MVIALTDRISTIIANHEQLIDVLADASPMFERLRNPAMRRVMARLVTVEQAARVAGVDPAWLLDRLNQAVNGSGTVLETAPAQPAPTAVEGLPAALAAVPPDRIHDVDVREELRAGGEPFSRIMAARREMHSGDVLRVRAIFEPAPLYAVMRKQGLENWTECLAEDDWRVWFFDAAAPAVPAPRNEPVPHGEHTIVLDVRDLEPPEPMVRTLAALEMLPAGESLLQINARIPQFLLPRLAERGFTYNASVLGPDLVHLVVRHAATPQDAAGDPS